MVAVLRNARAFYNTLLAVSSSRRCYNWDSLNYNWLAEYGILDIGSRLIFAERVSAVLLKFGSLPNQLTK